jgi:hypothetical protein
MDRPDFSMVVTMIEGDTFVGRICTGRIASGSAKVGDSVVALDNAGNKVDSGRITKIMARKGGARMELSGATAGDIVQVAGLAKATVGYTICSPDVKEALPANEIDPPTLVMTFCPNDSPMAGVSSRLVRARPFVRGNLAALCLICVPPSHSRALISFVRVLPIYFVGAPPSFLYSLLVSLASLYFSESQTTCCKQWSWQPRALSSICISMPLPES